MAEFGKALGASSLIPEQATETGIFPASAMQSLFCGIQKAYPDTMDFLVRSGFRILGHLDVSALRKAFGLLLASQPALRTVFFEKEGILFQRVMPDMPVAFEYLTGKDRYEAGVERDMMAVLRDSLKVPFDVSHGPLMRVILVREEDGVHLMTVVVHHAVSDATSMQLILGSVSTYYHEIVSGRTVTADTPPVHTGELAVVEHRSRLEGKWIEGRSYWLERFRQRGLEHPWPSRDMASEGPVRESSWEGVVEWAFDASLDKDIARFAKSIRSTRFRVWLGGYFLLQQRLHPGIPVTVGIPFDTRRFSKSEDLVGCLINMLPVTVDADMPGRVDDYLKNVAWQVNQAMQHGMVPYPIMLDDWMEACRDIRSSRWRTMLNWKDSEAGRLDLTGTKSELLHGFFNERGQDGVSADLGITIQRNSIERADGSLRLFVRYDDRVISRNRVIGILQA
jgi:hypothetical protein